MVFKKSTTSFKRQVHFHYMELFYKEFTAGFFVFIRAGNVGKRTIALWCIYVKPKIKVELYVTIQSDRILQTMFSIQRQHDFINSIL